MKRIKTAKYKESQLGDLPPGTSNADIERRFGDPPFSRKGSEEEIFIVDQDQEYDVTLNYEVWGSDINDPSNWDITYDILQVKDDMGEDVTQYCLQNDIPSPDNIKSSIKYVIINS
jgi:hypothetical protein